MGTTRAEAPTRLLDLTRLVSRAGRAFTGIDRVEYAYLVHLLDAGPLWGLVRSSMGYLLLDPEGCAALKRQFTAGDWPAPDLLSRLRRLPPGRAEALRTIKLSRPLLPSTFAVLSGRLLMVPLLTAPPLRRYSQHPSQYPSRPTRP